MINKCDVEIAILFWEGLKQLGKGGNANYEYFSPFHLMFLKGLGSRMVESSHCVVKGQTDLLIDGLIVWCLTAFSNSISVLLRQPVHLSMLS